MKITPVTGTDLWHRYPRQSAPQGAFVELDPERRTLGCETNPEIGNAVPADVWYGRLLRWPIPPLRADAANDLLAALAPLAERVAAGYSVEWDGTNHVGRLTDSARQACDAIERWCDQQAESDTLHVWEAAEWFAPLGRRDAQARELDITAETTDDELAAIVAREEAGAAGADTCDGLEDCEEYLFDLRAELRGEAGGERS